MTKSLSQRLPHIEQADVTGKRVLVRVDYNVPYDENWEVADATRLYESLPTINFLVEKKAKVILMSHRGGAEAFRVRDDRFFKTRTTITHRRFTYWSEKSVMEYVAKKLSEIMKREILWADDCIGDEVQRKIQSMKTGDILLLENLRFYKEETENDEGFARELAELADIYINDAFSACHRPHASLIGVPKFLPHYAGFSMFKEIKALDRLLESKEHPFLLLMGGAKVSDKIGVIENLLSKVDAVCIGGAMSYTFFKAKGYEVGKSKVEKDKVESTKVLLEKIKASGKAFYLPEDIVVSIRFAPDPTAKTVPSDQIPPSMMGMDIGEKTRENFCQQIRQSRRLFWNGPMGVFEMPIYAGGTMAVLEELKQYKGYAVIGGGESAQAARRIGLPDTVYIATGGGASLQYLSGKLLPGIQALLS